MTSEHVDDRLHQGAGIAIVRLFPPRRAAFTEGYLGGVDVPPCEPQTIRTARPQRRRDRASRRHQLVV
jgi:hypothetical protein